MANSELSLKSNSLARVVDLISEGPIKGIVDSSKGIYFNDTQLMANDGTLNFKGVVVATRLGTPTQTAMNGLPAVERETQVSVIVKQTTPIVRTITDSTVDALRVTLGMPLFERTADDGDIKGCAVDITIEVRAFGGSYVTVITDSITGRTNSPYERSYRFDLPAGGAPWDVRVNRLTIDNTSSKTNDDIYWSRYTELIDHKLTYPDSAYVGIQIDAQLFKEGFPSRSYLVDGLFMDVPVNYDPVARTYAGTWNGTFKSAWTNNPAWVLYMFLRNTRFGLGRWISASQINKWELYQIAQYCDELIDDGFGGKEPRFTFNGVIASSDDPFKTLQYIASSFRGMIYWGAGSIRVTQDRPSDPVVLVTPANVIDGNFEYSGSGLKSRHSAALITWNNPEDSYKTAVEVVEDPEMIQRLGWKPAEVVAPGCTSRGQAHRFGKWLLDTERYETETVTYRASFDHMIAGGNAVMPGDIIRLQDPYFAGIRYGGRIVSTQNILVAAVSRTEFTLDQPIQIVTGNTYTISVTLPDGTVKEYPVISAVGYSDKIVINTALATFPLDGAMWVLKSSSLSPRLFRVLTIREVEKNIVEVTALYHDPNKYARVEKNIQLEHSNFSLVSTLPLLPPKNLAARESIYREFGTVKSTTYLSWSRPNDARVTSYEAEIKRPSQGWTYLDNSDQQTVFTDTVREGTYSFRVRAKGLFGAVSPWTTLNNVYLYGIAIRPAAPTGLALTVVGDQAYLTWNVSTDPLVKFYSLRYQSSTIAPPAAGAAAWEAGIIISDTIPSTSTSIFAPLMTGTYMLKTVSVTGYESVSNAYIISDVKSVAAPNIVAQLPQQPTFTGTKTDCVVVGTTLRTSNVTATTYAPSAMYEFPGYFDLGAVYTSRLSGEISAMGVRSSPFIINWPVLNQLKSMSGAAGSRWSVVIEFSMTSDDPALGTAVWSPWQGLTIGNSTARAYKFRTILTSEDADINVIISTLSVTIDMPDRVEGQQAVVVPATGVNVVYASPFRVNPAVTVTIQNALMGDDVILTSETANGFTLRINNGGTAVARTANWIARGYGRKV